MNAFRIARADRSPIGLTVLTSLLAACLVAPQTLAAEPGLGPLGTPVRTAPLRGSPREELQRLIAGHATTPQLLRLVEQFYLTGRLWELGSGALPWAGWTAPGWRWETQLADGTRLVLATDGFILVAIREGRTLELSVLDVTAGGSSAGAEHILAASVRDLALKAPQLFPIYYYFAGPTAEIVSSHLLPRPPILTPLHRAPPAHADWPLRGPHPR